MMHAPQPPLLSRKEENAALLVAAAGWLLVFSFFFPAYFAGSDEHQYIMNAEQLAGGSFQGTASDWVCEARTLSNGSVVSNYAVGRSILLLPFLSSFSSLFWSGALLHVLNFLLLILIFRRLNLSPLFALLYLFFPAFQWEARTLYPELMVLTLFLSGYYLWLRSSVRNTVLTGVAVGLALFVRLDAFLGLLAFGAQAFFHERKRLLPFAAGAGGAIILLLAFNTWAYGSLLASSYGSSSPLLGTGSLVNALIEFITFPLLIIFVLPLSLFALVNPARPHRTLFAVLAFTTFVLFTRFYAFWALETSLPHVFTVRLRYFVPLIGMLLIPTAFFYRELIVTYFSRIGRSPQFLRAGLLIGIVLLLGASAYIQSEHQELLAGRAAISNLIRSTIPANAHVIGSADDCMFFIPAFFGENDYRKVTTLEPNAPLQPHTYVLEIAFLTQQNSDIPRQGVIDAERQKITDFIDAHAHELVKVAGSPDQGIVVWSNDPQEVLP